MSTSISGGSGVTNHHILPLFGGSGAQGHLGISQGMGSDGLRGVGAAGTSHGRIGSANIANGGHGFGDHGGGQLRGERFGQHNQSGFGHDTINLGSGHDSQVAAGHAAGVHVGYQIGSHGATMVGGAHLASFIGGHSLIAHGSASDTHTGGAAMVHGATNHMTTLMADNKVGADIIKNFVTGHDKLYLESHALSYLHSNVNVTISHGSTHIALDGGHTTIALKGFSHFDTGGHK